MRNPPLAASGVAAVGCPTATLSSGMSVQGDAEAHHSVAWGNGDEPGSLYQTGLLEADAMLLEMGRFNVTIDVLKSVLACIIASACCPRCVLLQLLKCL